VNKAAPQATATLTSGDVILDLLRGDALAMIKN
jgi:hypothetical protein